MHVPPASPFAAGALVLAAALAAAPGAARADGDAAALVERAGAAVARLDYEAALALYQQAEEAGQSSREQLVQIYRAMAESHAALGRADAAETSFRRLLALEPGTQLPEGSSPKLTVPFAAARDFLSGRHLEIECRRDGDSGGATLVVSSDPVDLVAGARLLGPGGERVPGADDAAGRGRIALPVPPRAPGSLSCAALDRHGNQLASAALTAAPAAGDTAAAATGAGDTARAALVSTDAPERPGRPLYARWWLWGAAAGVTAGVAIYYGIQVGKSEDELAELNEMTREEGHSIYYEDALAIEERGKRHARNANIFLGVTGALAAVSAGLLIHQIVSGEGGEVESARETARVDAAPLPGGAFVGVTLGF